MLESLLGTKMSHMDLPIVLELKMNAKMNQVMILGVISNKDHVFAFLCYMLIQ